MFNDWLTAYLVIALMVAVVSAFEQDSRHGNSDIFTILLVGLSWPILLTGILFMMVLSVLAVIDEKFGG